MRSFVLSLLFVSVLPVATLGDDPAKGAVSPAPLPAIPNVLPRVLDTVTAPDWKKASSDVPKETKAPEQPLPSGEKKSPPADLKKIKEGLEKLLQEREALTKGTPTESATTDERAKLKGQLADLLKELDKPKPKPVLPEKKPAHAEPAHKPDAALGGKLVDPLRLGMLKYQDGDAKSALLAFRLVDPNGQSAEEKAFTQYLIACCHKQLGQTNEALSLFREIAEAKQDAFITECALWQLGAIRQTRELDAQLEQLRVRRKAR
jgi:hypothetical protein